MGDDDTDSDMMRRQQAMDAAGAIAPGETGERRLPSHSDPQSASARAAAKAGTADTGEWAEDAVLSQNRAGLKPASYAEPRPARGGAVPDGSLASPGRSLLGD